MDANNRDNTPAHCWDCWKFADCPQAQNMTADTVPVAGFVVFVDGCGDHYCAACADDAGAPDSDCYPLDFEETDCPCHCSVCGAPLSHSLTADGVEHLTARLADGGGCCSELWPVVWADYLEVD